MSLNLIHTPVSAFTLGTAITDTVGTDRDLHGHIRIRSGTHTGTGIAGTRSGTLTGTDLPIGMTLGITIITIIIHHTDTQAAPNGLPIRA